MKEITRPIGGLIKKGIAWTQFEAAYPFIVFPILGAVLGLFLSWWMGVTPEKYFVNFFIGTGFGAWTPIVPVLIRFFTKLFDKLIDF